MRTNLDNLVYPYFVTGGRRKKQEIKNFPGIHRFSIDCLIKDLEESNALGINKVLLFGVPQSKDSSGKEAIKKNSLVSLAVKEIKRNFPDLNVFTDVCLCAYTDHGHCGLLDKKKKIDRQKTLKALAGMALSHAEAGADWVAPSAMAKQQVRAIRNLLDKSGMQKTKILGYSAKFASNFYGPFRNAAGSAPEFGDRTGYQLDYADLKSALAEISADIEEGADMAMVKPALTYLDVIKEARLIFKNPLAAYNVSGEYAFVKYGARQGLWDERKMVAEILTSIKRAGADLIITYHAKDVAVWLKEN